MKKKGLTFISITAAFLLVALFVFTPRSVLARQNDEPAMKELCQTALGKLSPGSLVDMDTFIKAAVPYITFEQGEDPIYVAGKQSYIKGVHNGPIRRNDALYPLLRMTGVDIPKGADVAQVAKRMGLIPVKNALYRKNDKITAAQACSMIVKARRAFYERLDAAPPAERFDTINYYFTPSQFAFSTDGQHLWYTERDSARTINTADGTVASAPIRPQPPQREEYPAREGEEAVCVYDNDGVLRAVSVEVSQRKNFMTAKYILYRESPDQPWRHLIDFDLSLTRDFEIGGFTPDNQRMYVKTNFYDNFVTLYELEPETMSRKMIYQNARADVMVDLYAAIIGLPGSSLRHPQTGRLLTALYVNDKPRVVCLDPKVKTIMARVGADLGEDQYPVAITPDFRYLVLLHRDDRDLGSYRLYDSKTGTARLISVANISKKDVGPTYPVSFKASDGETVFAYLTLPLGKSPRNLPLLINAHGGPQSRYSRTPDVYALLASNLGAAVLSVDFRFSLGYGNEYTDAGSQNKLLAQQDIFEACQWAIAKGIADPRHVGVMGHSYGGYSAFYQAAVHPAVYKAAVMMMGIWDWTDLGLELIKGQPVPDYHKCSAPEPGTELAKIMSPSTYAGQLKCPLLIIYSGKDEAVYPSQNIRAVKELKETGNNPQVLYLPDIGHVPSTVESINAVFKAIEDFLKKKFLPPGALPN